MTDRYAVEQVGVADGTKVPNDKLDGRLIGAKVRSIRASKQLVADQIADRVYLGKLPQGATLKEILFVTDTTLGSTTFSIGTTAAPAKYRALAVFTTPLNVPTVVGPPAAAWDDAPLTADEDVWVTFAAAALSGSIIMGWELRYTISA